MREEVLARDWVPVGVRRAGDVATITVEQFQIDLHQPAVNDTKRVGLIASYNQVRFDDVVVGVPK